MPEFHTCLEQPLRDVCMSSRASATNHSFPFLTMSTLVLPMILYPSIRAGRFSLIYSTTASGPFSTCSPCGSANVLIDGTMLFASAWILWLSAGVHIDAVNWIASALLLLLASSHTATYQDVWLVLLYHFADLLHVCGRWLAHPVPPYWRKLFLLSAFPEWMMVYLSLTSSTTRPMSRFARSGAVLTVTSLNGPNGCPDILCGFPKVDDDFVCTRASLLLRKKTGGFLPEIVWFLRSPKTPVSSLHCRTQLSRLMCLHTLPFSCAPT